MADRGSHYEASFEHVLREAAVPYVAVDEAKRALFGKAKLKGFDFLVYSRSGPNLLIDVKGRRTSGGRSVQTWVTRRDVEDLAQWERVFGDDFRAMLAFNFWIGDAEEEKGDQLPVAGVDPADLPGEPGVLDFRGRRYRMLGVGLEAYRNHMRERSAKWATVAVPTADFRRLATPIGSWL